MFAFQRLRAHFAGSRNNSHERARHLLPIVGNTLQSNGAREAERFNTGGESCRVLQAIKLRGAIRSRYYNSWFYRHGAIQCCRVGRSANN